MPHQCTSDYLAESLTLFRQYKKTAESAMAQVADEHLNTTLNSEMNSIAQIVKHMTGNMRSRWTDFLTTDGEKPNRNRDSEFIDPPATRQELLALWEEGWAVVFASLEPLSAADLTRTVRIRNEPHSVMPSIARSRIMPCIAARSSSCLSTSPAVIGSL